MHFRILFSPSRNRFSPFVATVNRFDVNHPLDVWKMELFLVETSIKNGVRHANLFSFRLNIGVQRHVVGA